MKLHIFCTQTIEVMLVVGCLRKRSDFLRINFSNGVRKCRFAFDLIFSPSFSTRLYKTGFSVYSTGFAQHKHTFYVKTGCPVIPLAFDQIGSSFYFCYSKLRKTEKSSFFRPVWYDRYLADNLFVWFSALLGATINARLCKLEKRYLNFGGSNGLFAVLLTVVGAS